MRKVKDSNLRAVSGCRVSSAMLSSTQPTFQNTVSPRQPDGYSITHAPFALSQHFCTKSYFRVSCVLYQ